MELQGVLYVELISSGGRFFYIIPVKCTISEWVTLDGSSCPFGGGWHVPTYDTCN